MTWLEYDCMPLEVAVELKLFFAPVFFFVCSSSFSISFASSIEPRFYKCCCKEECDCCSGLFVEKSVIEWREYKS